MVALVLGSLARTAVALLAMEKDLKCESDSKSSSQCAAHLVQKYSI